MDDMDRSEHFTFSKPQVTHTGFKTNVELSGRTKTPLKEEWNCSINDFEPENNSGWKKELYLQSEEQKFGLKFDRSSEHFTFSKPQVIHTGFKTNVELSGHTITPLKEEWNCSTNDFGPENSSGWKKELYLQSGEQELRLKLDEPPKGLQEIQSPGVKILEMKSFPSKIHTKRGKRLKLLEADDTPSPKKFKQDNPVLTDKTPISSVKLGKALFNSSQRKRFLKQRREKWVGSKSKKTNV